MQIISTNISRETGTVKQPAPEITVNGRGVHGDAHAGAWHRQVSLLSREIIKAFETEIGRRIEPGEFAENLTTSGLDIRRIAVLDRLLINDVELEVTQIGKECHGDTCAIFREVGKCVMPKEGVFCRVIKGGAIRPGDQLEFHPRPLRFRIITLSDRASRGDYEDRSGPRIRECLDEFLADTRWHPDIECTILPDEAKPLRAELTACRKAGVDVIFTTGGTGIGPRDITPDVVTALADKTIPGIMEHIRLKYGPVKPNALLSRSIAAVMGQTLVFALPGSVRAVSEYMEEILKTMEHLVLTLRGLDTH